MTLSFLDPIARVIGWACMVTFGLLSFGFIVVGVYEVIRNAWQRHRLESELQSYLRGLKRVAR